MPSRDFTLNGKLITLLSAASGAITTAQTGTTPGNGGASGVVIGSGVKYLGLEGVFVYGSAGTTVKAWIQTSFDGGVTWFDVVNFAFTTATLKKVAAVSADIVSAAPATPTDATLADNTMNNGLVGDRVRVKLTTTGTYADSTSLKIDLVAKA